MNKSDKFTHNHNEFEIRTSVIGDCHCVKVFLNDKLVSPIYSVDFEINTDYFAQHKESLIDNLKKIAKSDIENEMYLKV